MQFVEIMHETVINAHLEYSRIEQNGKEQNRIAYFSWKTCTSNPIF